MRRPSRRISAKRECGVHGRLLPSAKALQTVSGQIDTADKHMGTEQGADVVTIRLIY